MIYYYLYFILIFLIDANNSYNPTIIESNFVI